MTEPPQVISVLREFADESQGTVDLQQAVERLDNPPADLADVLKAPSAMDWHHTAIEGMRWLGLHGRLTREAGKVMLDATRDVALQFGIDEYYKSLDALSFSPETAPLLASFASEQLEHPTLRDARWLAFFAIASLLERRPEDVPDDIDSQLEKASSEETDTPRQQEMQTIVEKYFSLRRSV